MAFTTSGQETEWAYSYSPGAQMGPGAQPLSPIKGMNSHATDLAVIYVGYSSSSSPSTDWMLTLSGLTEKLPVDAFSVT